MRTSAVTIQRTVAAHFGLPRAALRAEDRSHDLAHPRQMAMLLTLELTPLSLPVIGNLYDRDHTTVLHAVEAQRLRNLTDKKANDDYFELRRQLVSAVDWKVRVREEVDACCAIANGLRVIKGKNR